MTSQDKLYNSWDYGTYHEYKKELILNELTDEGIFLDLGCGCGDVAEFIPINYSYLGLEFAKSQVKKGKKLGRRILEADLSRKFPFTEKVDVILASEILEHIFDTDLFIKECKRVLNRKGKLIITTPNICNLGDRLRCLIGIRPSVIECRAGKDYAGHIRAFTVKDVTTLLEDHGFKVTRVQGYEFFLPFGFKSRLLSLLFPTFSVGLFIVGEKK
jgi:SAM-dependent methyltransferase